MKIRCTHCGKKNRYTEEKCHYCGNSLSNDSLSVKDIHVLHQDAHNQITRNNDRKNSAMVFIVIGVILLIIGLLFLDISFKKDATQGGIRVFRPGSVEFAFCCITSACSLTCLIIGAIKLSIALSNIKFFKSVIDETKLSK